MKNRKKNEEGDPLIRDLNDTTMCVFFTNTWHIQEILETRLSLTFAYYVIVWFSETEGNKLGLVLSYRVLSM